MDYRTHLDTALTLCDLADAITLDRFRATDLVVETKPDLTPVTEADQAVERAIREHLRNVAPEHSVLGEEYGEEIGNSSFRWVVDPIDGTKNYVRGVPVWATLLGLEHDGVLVLGAVSAPALGARWWGGKGLGAWRNGEAITASRVASLDDAQLSFASDTSDGVGAKLLALSRRCWRTRGFGDFWQHMMVADGSCDISCDPILNYWDAAALIPILEAAGAQWSTVDGRTDSRTCDSLVCTNGTLHAEVLAALR